MPKTPSAARWPLVRGLVVATRNTRHLGRIPGLRGECWCTLARERPISYWLFKTEPGTYSWGDLVRDGRTCWEGVRNYQARNLMRDQMEFGDLVLVYHSGVKPLVVAGVARIVRGAYPDSFAQDPSSLYHDPGASAENPIWLMVDIEPVREIAPPITRDELKAAEDLTDMMVLRRGARLSVQPVTRAEWRAVLALRGLEGEAELVE